MKSIITFLIISLTVQNLFAQKLQPVDATISYDGKSRPCLFIKVDPEAKTLKEEWNDFLKDNYDLKLKGIGFLANKDLMSRKEVIVDEISTNAMNFYTEIIEGETGSEMRVFASFGYDIYIDASMQKEYAALRSMMVTFLNDYIPNYYQEIIDDTEKVVSNLSKDESKLKKSIAKDSKKITKLKSEIESLTEEVSENNSELEEVQKKLMNRREKLSKYKGKLSGVQ